LGSENRFSKQLDELSVITLDRVERQRHWEVGEFKHLYRLRRHFQSWMGEMRRGKEKWKRKRAQSLFSLASYDHGSHHFAQTDIQ